MLKVNRKGVNHLRVPVLPEEEVIIKHLASNSGLSVASYLRNVGMGYEVKSVLDLQQIKGLAQINADLGRLGGLLKLWLTNDEKLIRYKKYNIREMIPKVLFKIDENQNLIRKLMSEIVTL